MTLNIPIHYRLAIFYFLYYAIVGVFLPYWNLYLEYFQFSYLEIGVLTTVAVLTRFVAPFVWGWLADYTGRRMFWVRIATCVEALIWLLIFFVDKKFLYIATIMLVFSFFQNAILAQFEGVTLFWLKDKHQTLYAKIRKWGSIGFIAGVFVIGALLKFISIGYLPVLLLLVASSAFLWSLTIAEPHGAPRAQKKLQPLWPTLKQPIVAGFFIIEFILLFSQAPFYSFYSNYLQQFGYSTLMIGTLWSLGVVAEIIMFAYAYWFFRRFSWHQLILFCLLLTSLRWFIVGLFPTIVLLQVVAQSLHAFSFALFHLLAMRVIVQNFSPEQQGRGQALYSTMWGLGVALGSLLAGKYWQDIGGSMIFMLAGVSALFGLLFLPAISKQRQQHV